ncbi:MAG: hypothetical protein LBH16_07250 [Treponema sp.]|jgi:hypothetical protein|nr:hypothetical protein [Treponema sp.]
MNFDKLVSNLQEEEKKLENEVLPYCNPQQIANEIMSNLEKATPQRENWTSPQAGYFCEAGSLFTQYELWFIGKHEKYGQTRGPICNCNDKFSLSNKILNLVRKYINEDMIKLDLERLELEDSKISAMYLNACISKADVEKILKMKST